MAINIKSEREIQLMRESCKILAKVHDELGKFLKPGITTADINKYGDELIRSFGCVPANRSSLTHISQVYVYRSMKRAFMEYRVRECLRKAIS